MQILTDKKIKEVFTAIPEIETKELILRKITEKDSEDMFCYSKENIVTEYLTWATHKSLAETQRYIRLLTKKYAAGAFWDFGLEHKADGRFIGTCGFTSFNKDENSAEIGYVLAPDYWGKGLAVEAARAVMKFGFAVFDLDKICARFIVGNSASERVMQKLGMSYVTTYKNSFFIKNSYKTVTEYAITKREFFEKNADKF
ncbi:MAG: GNAT family N-acetyltransferase [Clostridia bacterium]|nr:GNAT family N-acetyltransferase [Clostridia bacterium]